MTVDQYSSVGVRWLSRRRRSRFLV